MKKSLIGMILLGIMVFSRAFLINEGGEEMPLFVRESSNLTVHLHHHQIQSYDFETKPSAFLREVAARLDLPEVQQSKQREVLSISTKQESEISLSPSTLIAHNSETEMAHSDEVIPMDYVSDTGYGLWNSGPSEAGEVEQTSGSVPLDRGSTISDNFNRLFPRRSF
ncbi:MAG: hypothetical protein WDZ35_05570 [Crocinitomicaceae bacterium]